jgi:hypothetical protein
LSSTPLRPLQATQPKLVALRPLRSLFCLAIANAETFRGLRKFLDIFHRGDAKNAERESVKVENSAYSVPLRSILLF